MTELIPEKLKIHPAAELFPMMSQSDVFKLTEDIRQHGLKNRLTAIGTSLSDCELIDGRNRLVALDAIGEHWSDHIELVAPGNVPDPIAYVVSLNLHRRHLTDSQRSMIAAQIANMKKGDNQHTATAACSQTKAAKMMRVSVDSVQRAKKVVDQAVPELVEAVKQARVTVSAAAKVVKLPKREQRQLIHAGPKSINPTTQAKNLAMRVISGNIKRGWQELGKKERQEFIAWALLDESQKPESKSKAMDLAQGAVSLLIKISTRDRSRKDAFNWIRRVLDTTLDRHAEDDSPHIQTVGGAK
jgi:hypothetical protein